MTKQTITKKDGRLLTYYRFTKESKVESRESKVESRKSKV